MNEIRITLFKAGIGLGVLAATPFVTKAANGLSESESWQWWNKAEKTSTAE